MITFDRVTKHYGEHTALANVTFTIPTGSFVSIIGPSGAGKTTIAKLILGAEYPTSGSVSVEGVPITTLDRNALQLHRQRVGVIFQDFKLLSYKTVFENVAFVLEVCGTPEEEITSKVERALATVNMLPAASKFPRALSGGEQQRVAIARAIVHEPRIILADEPTGNLDHQHTTEVIALLKKIHTPSTTILLMTHDRDIVNSLGQRVIELKEHTVVRDEARGVYEGSTS